MAPLAFEMRWSSKVSAKVFALVILTVFRGTHAWTDEEWTMTIDIAGRQRMLSQRMAKEFLLVAKGKDVAADKKAMMESMNLFDSSLQDMMKGNADEKVIKSPEPVIEEANNAVLGLWTDFKAFLEKNVDTVTRESTSIFKDMDAKSLVLNTRSNTVVGMLTVAAKSAGVKTSGVAVDIAGRQSMLMQRMCKETYLIGLDVNVTANRQKLEGTATLFDDSHTGLIVGSGWTGIPVLSNMCTLQQMQHVTYNWDIFKLSIEAILGAGNDAPALVTEQTEQLVEESNALYASIMAVVELFVHEDNSCTPIENITEFGWTYLVKNLGVQRKYVQMASVYFMEIAVGYEVETSKVNLVTLITTLEMHLRTLIEGSRAKKIPAPPLQKIVDEMLIIWEDWLKLKRDFTDSVQDDRVSATQVASVDEKSRHALHELNIVAGIIVDKAEKHAPNVESYVVDVAEYQTVRIEQAAKVALLIKYYISGASGSGSDYSQLTANLWNELNKTLVDFEDAHWKILKGDASHEPPVPPTASLCTIWQMSYAKTQFDKLVRDTRLVASGDTSMISGMAKHMDAAVEEMTLAIDYYVSHMFRYVDGAAHRRLGGGAAASAASTNATCSTEWKVGEEQWKAAITEVGLTRSLTQKVASEYLLHRRAETHATSTKADDEGIASHDLQGTVKGMALSLDMLHYGYLDHDIPAPPDAELLKKNEELIALWYAFRAVLPAEVQAQKSTAASQGTPEDHRRLASAPPPQQEGSCSDILKNSDATLLESEVLIDRYLQKGRASIGEVPSKRMNLVSRQIMLANKMVKEVMLIEFGGCNGEAVSVETTIAEFESAHKILKDGGNGLPKIIQQRGDLEAQYASMDARWKDLQFQVGSADSSASSMKQLKVALEALETELAAAIAFFGKADPHVPSVNDWAWMIYVMGVLPYLIVVSCAGCYKGGAWNTITRKQGAGVKGSSKDGKGENGSRVKGSGGDQQFNSVL